MLYYEDLKGGPEERRKEIRSLIRSGHIRLGGYKKARIFGLLSCSSGKKMKVVNRVFFADETEAFAAGYRPCGHCLPEKYKKWKAEK
ncbi:metal-binding protein [Niabella sp. CC-SYL272]|uniref:Ada metal-binding domain-containing protein n=1 Tax=Niabella agricola TaxID=2891571 RepID=UPI001F1BF66A|nr:Ada metal-binding domain-containing protein [Niabella agricola]MCF3108788.1 metal-binding protein [Niabella agricola]